MGIKFTSLTIKNFLSYGATPTVISLERGGTTLIVGEDLDNTSGGTGANGVGKTVIINALAYGVYDKPISDISKDNLVNNVNKRHMEVVVEFDKGNDKYMIKRARKMKAGAAGNYVHFFENGVDITPDSAANTNKLIESVIGLPYELFVRIVVFSATHTPFLDLPVRHATAPNQTDIIEELFGLTTLSEKAVLLTEQRKEVESELKSYKERVDVLEQELARHENQLTSAKQRVLTWQKNTDEEVVKLKKKIERISYDDLDEQMGFRERVLELDEQIKGYKSLIADQTTKLKAAWKDEKQADTELKHLHDDECPYCHQEYAGASEKIEEATKTKKESGELIEQISDEIEQLEAECAKTEKERDEFKAKVKGGATLTELKDALAKSDEYKRKIVELEEMINPYLEPLEELEEVELEAISYDKINELTTKIEHMKFLYKLLTKKDSFVRKVLLNKNLPFLNGRLSYYLSKLGLTHQVEFTHEMTASISQFGRPLDFGNLSNGQRARVNIALSFAFRDVLQQLHQRINICMLDEVLDVGLDAIGVTAAARMLKRKARDENLSLYIISHRDEIDSVFDNTMTVQLKDGFSQILET